MIKNFIKYFLILLIPIILGIIYLSYVGIETKRFNQLIKNEINQNNQKIDIDLKDVKFILDLTNFSVGLKTYNPSIIFKNKKINLKKIETNFFIKSFLKKEFAVKNVSISTKKNNFKDIVSLIQTYKNTPQLFIFAKMIKDGNFNADINLNFNEQGRISNDYIINGAIKNANISLLNKQTINNINLSFKITDGKYLFKNTQFEFNHLKLISNKITVQKEDGNFLVKGDIENLEGAINNKVLQFSLFNKFNDIGLSDINLLSKNNFFFKISKKFKISDIKIESKTSLKKLSYKKDFLELKNYLPNFNNLIELNDHKIELIFNNNKISIKGNGKFNIDKHLDEIDYDIKFDKGDYNFKSTIQFNNNPVVIKVLNYGKDATKNSILNIEGSFKKNKTMFFEKILFNELENKFLINGLSLNEILKLMMLKK